MGGWEGGGQEESKGLVHVEPPSTELDHLQSYAQQCHTTGYMICLLLGFSIVFIWDHFREKGT